ncbi:DUF4350 domain-containing protein [Halopiger djelfimassiliensis]|uniref:DUF4350 domain-containing protein n=1 Tax=Halopiger djelfimassiliensis TaxID=1293047 RepID=UPI00067816CF|nr:DUF4350 domain-containing protein [Halopiger djelfimassiliensis]
MTVREWIEARTGIELTVPVLVLAVFLAVVLGTVLVAASTSAAGFGPYNPSWDGTSEFREGIQSNPAVELEVIDGTERYPTDESATETVAFVVAPEQPYEPAEADRLREFTERGGALVVLDTVETNANRLLEDVGVDARLDGRLLLDQRRYDRGPAMPLVTPVENHTATAGVDRLTLNHATAIEPGNATVLVRTSEFSYLANSTDEELDDRANLTAAPVVTTEPVGDGEVILVGDPSITINAMIDESDNHAFLEGLYKENSRVLIDRSGSDGVPPLVAFVGTIRRVPLLQALLGAVVLGTVAVVASPRSNEFHETIRIRLSSSENHRSSKLESPPEPLSKDELAAILRSQYPEWDEKRIDRVITAFNRTRSKHDEQ